MQFSVEKISEFERKIKVSLPPEKIDHEILVKLRQITTQVKLPGFRPGKVPFSVVQKRYTDSVRVEVIENVIRDSFHEVLQKENLRLAAAAKFELGENKPNEPFTYQAEFEIFPEVQLRDFAEMRVDRPVAEVTEKDVDEAIEKLRHEQVMWKEITEKSRPATRGDQVVVDFTVRVRSDKPTEPREEKNIEIVLGDGKMWTDFENHLYNSHVGDEVKFMLTFPVTHYDRELSGKSADFTVKVHKVSEPIYPPIDDELAKKVGVKNGGLTALKQEVKTSLTRELDGALKSIFKKSIMDALIKANPLSLPNNLVVEEIKRLQENFRQRFAGMKKTDQEIPELAAEKCQPSAVRNVSLGLLLSTLIKERGIKVDPAEVKAKVEEMASVYDDSSKIINWYYSNHEHLAEVESHLLEEKAIEEIGKNAKVVDKPMSFHEALKHSRGGE